MQNQYTREDTKNQGGGFKVTTTKDLGRDQFVERTITVLALTKNRDIAIDFMIVRKTSKRGRGNAVRTRAEILAMEIPRAHFAGFLAEVNRGANFEGEPVQPVEQISESPKITNTLGGSSVVSEYDMKTARWVTSRKDDQGVEMGPSLVTEHVKGMLNHHSYCVEIMNKAAKRSKLKGK